MNKKPRKTTKNKIVVMAFEGVVKYEKEDSGQALIATIYDSVPKGANPTMFVRIQSWEDADPNQDKDPDHYTARILEGKKVRVTVEVI